MPDPKTEPTSSFVAREEVEALRYDFEPFVPDAKGDIPEPTAAQINAFRTGIAAMLEATLPEATKLPAIAGEESEETLAAKQTKALIAVIGRDQTADQQKALHMIADVCSNSPSFDQLNALPWRHQQGFTGWLTGQLLLPQTKTPATNG